MGASRFGRGSRPQPEPEPGPSMAEGHAMAMGLGLALGPAWPEAMTCPWPDAIGMAIDSGEPDHWIEPDLNALLHIMIMYDDQIRLVG